MKLKVACMPTRQISKTDTQSQYQTRSNATITLIALPVNTSGLSTYTKIIHIQEQLKQLKEHEAKQINFIYLQEVLALAYY
jgi:hypothetical protein